MDLDDLFDRSTNRAGDRHDRRDRDDRDRGRHHRDDRRRTGRRRAHPHRFAWLVLAGGGVLVALAVVALASALGVWGHAADAYFAAGRAVLPSSWHGGWMALPGIAHLAIVLGTLFVVVGLAGELVD